MTEPTQEQLALAERCEQAEHLQDDGGYEPNGDIARALGWTYRLREGFGYWQWHSPTNANHIQASAPAYTSSIDTALTLVPEGWNVRLEQTSKGQMDDNTSVETLPAWSAHIIHDDDTGYANRKRSIHGWKHGYAATPALALCAAALRARFTP